MARQGRARTESKGGFTARESSARLIEQIIDQRAADLAHAMHVAFAKALRSDPVFARAGTVVERGDDNTFLGYPGAVYARDAKTRRYRYPEAAARLEAIRVLAHLIPKLVRMIPSLTRQQALDFLHGAWPSSRGTRARAMFKSTLVTAARDALLRENPTWGRRAAVDTLAERLAVDPRTIRKYLAPPRRARHSIRK